MKRILIILFMIASISSFGQDWNKVEKNDCKELNEQEAELLNSLLESSRGTFDFQGKKAAFITGSSGNVILFKSNYFKTAVLPWLNKGDKPQVFMAVLTPEEKKKSGGYDVIVMSWVKFLTDRQKKRIVKRLAKLPSDNCL